MAKVHPKVQAGGGAGALSVLLVFLVHQILGWDVPPEVASSFTTLVAAGAAYRKSA